MAAHEFGHVLGLGDAYAANYRFYYEAPGTKNYMMNRNVRVSEEEVQMVLKAHKTGKMQYFPMEVSLKRFFKGLVKHWFLRPSAQILIVCKMYTNCTNKIEKLIYKLYDIPIKLITEMEAQLYEEVSRLRYGHC